MSSDNGTMKKSQATITYWTCDSQQNFLRMILLAINRHVCEQEGGSNLLPYYVLQDVVLIVNFLSKIL